MIPPPLPARKSIDYRSQSEQCQLFQLSFHNAQKSGATEIEWLNPTFHQMDRGEKNLRLADSPD
jgi:hypothetical protein